MKINCSIIRDLIPLVKDDVASDESKKMVLGHCLECEACKSYIGETLVYNSDSIDQKWKRKIKITGYGMELLLILLACSFSASMNQFQNFILIPFIGGIGYALLKQKVYLIYLLILISHILMELMFKNLGISILFYTVIYWIFLTVGIAIYCCFAFALKRRNENESES